MIDQTAVNWAVVLGGAGAAISAFLSWRQMVKAHRQRQADLLAEIAVRHLERAWNALTVYNTQVSPPPADRLRWLTTARHIIEYKNTFELISDAGAQRRCQAEEAYWRQRFYEALHPLQMDFGYYPDWTKLVTLTSRDLEKSSAVIVHRFADWPEGKPDAIDMAVQRYAEMTDPTQLSRRWAALRKALGLLEGSQPQE